jgi:hypothetical protein
MTGPQRELKRLQLKNAKDLLDLAHDVVLHVWTNEEDDLKNQPDHWRESKQGQAAHERLDAILKAGDQIKIAIQTLTALKDSEIE